MIDLHLYQVNHINHLTFRQSFVRAINYIKKQVVAQVVANTFLIRVIRVRAQPVTAVIFFFFSNLLITIAVSFCKVLVKSSHTKNISNEIFFLIISAFLD